MRKRWSELTIAAALLVPLLWSFGSMLTGTRLCAYRDTASFYYPLYAWSSHCWSRGMIPLWNPQDNIGMPVAAEATSAVFYPGQLIFALGLPYALSFNLYVILHVVLAATGAMLLAHQLVVNCREGPYRQVGSADEDCSPGQLQRYGMAVAGLAYAFSGIVLFQTCNVVFLVGAAWLPLGLFASDRMLTTGRRTWAMVLGAVLALMVLGGDPQMAYHTGLLAAFWAALRVLAARGFKSGTGQRPHAPPTHRLSLGLLALAAVTAAALSAVQVVVALPLARASTRADTSAEDSLTKVWFGKPARGTHQELRYAFSVAPWRVAEFVWPNVSGHLFPMNQRWLSALRGEDRVWTPTLYVGLLPLVLALRRWRLRACDPDTRWLSLIAVGALLASFGWYGLGWIAGEVTRVAAPDRAVSIGEPVGGLYWWMVHLLPGYGYFRYPAKLLVIVALAISQLAALGWEATLTAGRLSVVRWFRTLAWISVVAGAGFLTSGLWWSGWFTNAAADELFGPLDVRGAWLGCLAACTQTALLSGLCWWWLQRARWPLPHLAAVLLLATSVDLAWSNGSHVLTAPAGAMEAQPVMPTRSLMARGQPVRRIYRPPRRRWVPSTWLAGGDPQRAVQTVRWDRATLMPKYHLLGPLGSVASSNTLCPRDYRQLLASGPAGIPDPRILDLLGVQTLVLPSDTTWPGAERVSSDTECENVVVWENKNAFPRAWIVHHVRTWSERSDAKSVPAAAAHRLPDPSVVGDLRDTAFVESPDGSLPDPEPRAVAGESCRILAEEGGRIDLTATLTRPGMVVLSNYFDPGWSAEIRTGNAVRHEAVRRVNGILQGILLPAGRHQLQLRYCPPGFRAAAVISCLGWLLVALVVVRQISSGYLLTGNPADV